MPSITFRPSPAIPTLSSLFTRGEYADLVRDQPDATRRRCTRCSPAAFRPITSRSSLDEKTKQYAAVPKIDRNRQREFGLYVQDTWRAARNLTINLGLRFEKQGAYENLNGLYSRVGYDGLWGVSGRRQSLQARDRSPAWFRVHLPAPATATTLRRHGRLRSASPGRFRRYEGPPRQDLRQPRGRSVIRAGYAISTVREGQNLFISLWGANQGLTQTATVSNAATPADFGAAGSVLFRQANLPVKSGLATTPVVSRSLAAFNTSLNDFTPNMSLGYVQSWNIGWQRELGTDTVVEVPLSPATTACISGASTTSTKSTSSRTASSTSSRSPRTTCASRAAATSRRTPA